jgi:hypothetical protein
VGRLSEAALKRAVTGLSMPDLGEKNFGMYDGCLLIYALGVG